MNLGASAMFLANHDFIPTKNALKCFPLI